MPRLRSNLDFMPSPVPDRPGLLIRDPFRYTDATLIVPPPLVECLQCFDGTQTDLDLRAALVRITGDLQVGDLELRLIETLSASGFLDDHVFAEIREARRTEFADAARREAAHAGAAYPDEVEELADLMNAYMGAPADPLADGLCAIAAPHVSPEGGWQSYRAAYRALAPQYKERTFVVLGTSHYGEPERFGLTCKPFVTPFGETQVNLPLANELAERAPESVNMEDYCHAVEHSIEFQVVFLQHLYGPGIRILPILCGSYARSILGGGKPEDDERVRRFLDVLGDVAAREGDGLFWVLGIDMAHMGRRYGDPFPAIAERNELAEVAERDRDRIGRMIAGDADGFWELVRENRDDLKWCGSSPVYTFMKAQPQCAGTLLRYEQWNIDAQSVVSFAGMSFTRKER
ncbi:MAG: AmmeMemoRadiSam system protein B [Bryobacteraceae bacterium]